MLSKGKFKDVIEKNSEIFAVVDEKSFAYALESNIKIIFILSASIINLQTKVDKLLKRDKTVFVHVDMVSGLDSSPAAIDYIATVFKGDIGVITTRHSLVKRANQKNLRVVYRAFMVDSTSKRSLITNLDLNVVPDAIEIMPASSIKTIKEIKDLYPRLTIIAGGLITEKKEVKAVLRAGASAISTSSVNIFD